MNLQKARKLAQRIADEYQHDTGFEALNTTGGLRKARSVKAIRELVKADLRWYRTWSEECLLNTENRLDELLS